MNQKSSVASALRTAIDRIEDMLKDNDGQAFKEARKSLPALSAALAASAPTVDGVLTDDEIDHTLARTLEEFARSDRTMTDWRDVRTDIAENSKLRRLFARNILAATPSSPASTVGGETAASMLDKCLRIVIETEENIGAGSFQEQAQYERQIVGPYLDGIIDEMRSWIGRDKCPECGCFYGYHDKGCKGDNLAAQEPSAASAPTVGGAPAVVPAGDAVRTLAEQIDAMVRLFGSLRRMSEMLGIDVGYLSRLRSGEKTDPSDEILKTLGLRRVVTYEPIYRATPLTPRTKSA